MGLLLVDDFLCLEFLFLFVLNITEKEHIVAAFAWSKFHLYIMRSYRAPAMGMAVSWMSFHNGIGSRLLTVKSDKRLTVSIEPLDRRIDSIEGVMVAAFPVFRLVIDG